MEAVREDMTEVEVNEEDTEGWNNWIWKSAVATPDGKHRKQKKSMLMIYFLT